ncbi:hypothetical protein [Kroppenstedtia eburnea]|uniref:hypothetical protein n=1 Tax=Kroppenstedtia eburnea TaxID=714067 RepID=UPI0036D3C0E0
MEEQLLQKLPEDERNMLISVCEKHGVKPHHLYVLLNIEEEYSLKSAARRHGVRPDISKQIGKWLKQEGLI